MKKLLPMLLLLALLAAFALAEGTESTPLTFAEMTAWQDSSAKDINESGTISQNDEGIYELVQSGVTYQLTQNAPAKPYAEQVTGLLLTARSDSDDFYSCPRSLIPTNSLKVLLAAYRNDNPSLAGTRDEAVLYLSGDLEQGASAGVIKRDGQRVDIVEHCAYGYLPDGTLAKSAVVYTIENGMIAAIRAIFPASIAKQDAQNELNALSSLQEKTDYYTYTQRDNTALEREDLTFAGMDFLDMTPEEALNTLGTPESDNWYDDSTGDTLRVMTWRDVSVTFLYDANKRFLRADMLTLEGNTLEGPRGLRCGDTMDAVLSRFPYEAESLEGNLVPLYGDGVNAPYGLYEYYAGSVTLRYAMALSEGGVTLMLSFPENGLDNMTIYHW